MADTVSRAFKDGTFFKAANNLTQYFNHNIPLPQSISWEEFTPPERLTQQVMSLLCGEQSTMGSLLRLPKTGENTGKHGFTTLTSGKLIPSSKTVTALMQLLSLQLLLQGSGQATSAAAFKLKFQPFLQPLQPSQRPSVWLENPAPLKRQKTNTSTNQEAYQRTPKRRSSPNTPISSTCNSC